MADQITFRDFQSADRAACLALFDANCPEFFAANERADYLAFLHLAPAGYEVCLQGAAIVGAFGLILDQRAASLRWILFDPKWQGRGIGTRTMRRVLEAAAARGATALLIAASHRSEPFFVRFGAGRVKYTADGWGPGMHRADLVIQLDHDQR